MEQIYCVGIGSVYCIKIIINPQQNFFFASGVGLPLYSKNVYITVLHNDPAAYQDHCGIAGFEPGTITSP